MDWSTAAVLITLITFLFVAGVVTLFIKVMAWLTRSAAKSVKKTAAVVTYPANHFYRR